MREREGSRWICRGVTLDLARGPVIMGVLNVTPDSLFDGSRHATPEAAIEHGLKLVADGATILDVGGESTRPGSEPVSVEEELRRVLPVLAGLARRTDALISIDTSKAAVARAALDAGAHIVNDVTACLGDPDMASVVASAKAGLVLMHMQGTPRTMQQAPHYHDVVGEVGGHLRTRLEAVGEAGVPCEAVVADPGIGFGKTDEHNLALLTSLDRLRVSAGRPLLLGVSRKGFIGRLLGRAAVQDRLAGGLAVLCHAVRQGVAVLRVHDVKESCDAARMMAILRDTEARGWSG